MNCKPGDLAIIVKSENGESVGKIVEVVSAGHICPRDGLEWMVRLSSMMTMTNGEIIPAGGVTTCPDAWLRPVSGLPDTTDIDEQLKEPA